MASNFAKLDKFEWVDIRRWQKKMHFLLSSMSVVYVLTTPIPGDGGDDATVEQIRKRAKWDNNDYVCRGLILNGSGVGVDTAYPMYWIWRIGVSWSRDHARIRRIFFDGYGVLVVRIVIFKISSFKL
ncbi:hypothetical protein Tco_1165803 [Tanacetum coccineum]